MSLRVGKSTICSNPSSATISRKARLVLIGYCLLVMVCSDQLISGRLKSPPIKKIFYLVFRSDGMYFFRHVVQLSVVCFIWSAIKCTYVKAFSFSLLNLLFQCSRYHYSSMRVFWAVSAFPVILEIIWDDLASNFKLKSSHVSVPIIISGSVDSIIASSSLSFFFKLLKFMFNILRCFFVAGLVFGFGFGDDVMIVEPALKDIESKD